MSEYGCSCFLKREFEKYGHDSTSSVLLASEYKLNAKTMETTKTLTLNKCLEEAQKKGMSKEKAEAACKDSD